MSDKTIKTFEELHSAIQSFGKRIISYRGQKEVDWEVKPKIGRYKKFETGDIPNLPLVCLTRGKLSVDCIDI